MVLSRFKNLLKAARSRIKSLDQTVDLNLLIFLALVLNVSLAVKLIALLFVYATRPDFRFGLRSGKIPKFYALMVALSFLEYSLNAWRGLNYALLSGLIIIFWLGSMLFTHQLRLSAEQSASRNNQRVINAFSCFMVLNAIVSMLQLIHIMIETRYLNPY